MDMKIFLQAILKHPTSSWKPHSQATWDNMKSLPSVTGPGWPAAVMVGMPLALGLLDVSPDDHEMLFHVPQH